MQVAGVPPLPEAGSVLPAAEEVWLDFRQRLRAFVTRRLRNPADVEDIVQSVFLQLHRRGGEIRREERVHAWLYTTARRAIADFYRSGSRRREVASGDRADLEVLQPAAGVKQDEGPDTRQEIASCLAPIVDRLAPSDREAILLTEIHGMRLQAAAARASISLSGMKSRVQRARARLRQAILDCCEIALDGRGAPMSCSTRDPDASTCCSRAHDQAGALNQAHHSENPL